MNRIIIKADQGRYIINRHIYGHFSEHLGRCIYGGLWVGENSPIPNTHGIRDDVVEALRAINVPNLRWPGGCFADSYHWKDGVGPKKSRPSMVNQVWGKVIENNHFGTHEFMDLCEQVGCEPYICGNVGSGTVREMQDWVEYLTFGGDSPMANWRRKNGREAPWRVPFWGIGNENWGCGGNMTPEYYADLYCHYQTYIGTSPDNPLMKIASGYGGSDTSGEGLDALLRQVLRRVNRIPIEAVSLHYYVYLPNSPEHSATQFGEREWFVVLKKASEIENAISDHAAILDRYDPDKRIWLIVDEWGNWYPAEPGTNPAFLYQQNSLRDALTAGLTLHIFHRYGDRVQMANIAQMVNVLQAVILTEDDQMVLTPTYHVFEMFKAHQDAMLLPLDMQCESYTFDGDTLPALSASASRDQRGQVLLTLCNLNPTADLDLDCELQGMRASRIVGRILTADEMTAHNTFSRPYAVRPVAFDGAQLDGGELLMQLPAKSVVALTIT
jgi:alpha-N-arabinofuranosidase